MIDIKTYQDLLEVGKSEEKRMEFVFNAINEQRTTSQYKIAEDAELYYKHQNPTIMRYEKFILNQAGQKVPDIWSPNNKIASNWYFYFTTQGVQYLLGNGISFGKKETLNKLGKKFEKRINEMATYAKNAGVCFGFWNYDHLEVFPIINTDQTVGFLPLYDEENGALRAGIRFWQLADTKPLHATLYEEDGITSYKKAVGKKAELVKQKGTYKKSRNYIQKTGETVGYSDEDNYSSLPIFPMFNVNKQSELVGNQNTLDAYDLIMSGLVNNVDEGEFIYWILKNCGGMDSIDDAKFVEQLKLTRVAHADGEEGAEVEAHKVEIPYNASQVSLEILEKRLFKDFMALKVEDISASSVTNDQIQAAYEPINQKTDAFEYEVTNFIETLLEFIGVEDTPTYTRSQMSNQTEVIDNVLKSSEYLDTEYITRKILAVLGDVDKAEEMLKRIQSEEVNRYTPTEPIVSEEQGVIEE